MTLLSRLRAVVESGEPVSNELAREVLVERTAIDRLLGDVAAQFREDVEHCDTGSELRERVERLLASVEAMRCK